MTSPTGAAVRDFVEVLRGRWKGAHVTVIPVRVQGEGAAIEIAQAIGQANRMRPRLDVLVVGRGGGSLEDLWCFNEEIVVRAIHGSEVPVVSAVGHEIDVTLSDLVADARALTPTDAGPLFVPSLEELHAALGTFRPRLPHGPLPLRPHDALDPPPPFQALKGPHPRHLRPRSPTCLRSPSQVHLWLQRRDRKITRLNSSHVVISYAVFCLKKKNPSPHTYLLDNRCVVH